MHTLYNNAGTSQESRDMSGGFSSNFCNRLRGSNKIPFEEARATHVGPDSKHVIREAERVDGNWTLLV
jgi:hypothetical protein